MSDSILTSIRLIKSNRSVLDAIAARSGESRSVVLNNIILDAAKRLYSSGLVAIMKDFQAETGKNPLEDQDGFQAYLDAIENNIGNLFAQLVADGYMEKRGHE